jgi:osmotically-inducible protein OsmY
MKTTLILASIALASVLGCDYDNRTSRPIDQTTPSTSPSTSVPAGSETTTPSTMNEADRQLAQRVSDTLRQDGTLGSAAQNVMVSASNGAVTLRGSVSSEQEKNDLAAKAQQVVGVTRVNNELEVSSASR